MRILFIDDDDSIRQLFTMHLDNCFNAVDIVEKASGNDAINFLMKDTKFDLIISDYNMPNGTGGDLYKFVVAAKINVPFILFTTEEISSLKEFSKFSDHHPANSYIQKPTTGEEFKSAIVDLARVHFTHTENRSDANFKKVRLLYFLRFNRVLCDIYVKISEGKFVKIVHRNDLYTREDIAKYANRNIKFLYVVREDYESFSNSFATTPFLVEDKTIPSHQVEHAVSSTLEVIQGLVQSVGITQTTVKLVNDCVGQIERCLHKEDALKSLLTKLRNRKDFLFDHSFILGSVVSAICIEMNWDSIETRKKLSYAALLHDITLDDPDMAYAFDLMTNGMLDYSEEAIEKYKEHPSAIASLIQSNAEIPANVDSVVSLHHELPTQNGFPKELGAHNIPQLAATFIIAHAFVSELYREDFNDEALPQILNTLRLRKFDTGNFKLPMGGLEKLVEKGMNSLRSTR